MTRDERSPLLYLRDIDKALDKILSRTRIMNFDSFIKDEFFIDAVVRNLQIMGEAAKFLPEEMKELHPTIPWRKIIGLKNIITHAYFKVDPVIIWDIITSNLPGLKVAIDDLVANIENSTG